MRVRGPSRLVGQYKAKAYYRSTVQPPLSTFSTVPFTVKDPVRGYESREPTRPYTYPLPALRHTLQEARSQLLLNDTKC